MPVGSGTVGPGISSPSTGGGVGTVTKLAGTSSSGHALTSGTDVTILTYTTPNDGEMHHAQLAWTLLAGASGTTGGAIRFIYTSGGTQNFESINAGGLSDNDYLEGTSTFTIDPDTTVTLQQQTPLAAGAATMFATIIGE